MHPTDKKMFLFAALYAKRHHNDQEVETYTIITVDSGKKLSWLHDRQPAILDNEDKLRLWLDPSISFDEAVRAIETVDEGIQYYEVSDVVNSIKK